MSAPRAWGPLACATLLGCGLNLPSESQVEDLRILDLQVTPPEISLFERGALTLDPAALPPFLRQEVRVRALVAHPDLDASFEVGWVRCRPGLGRIPCDEGETRELLASGSTLGFSYVPADLVLADVVQGEGSLDALAKSFVEDPRDLINGLYAYINAEVRVSAAELAVDTPVLEGVKRVVVFEPRLVAQAIREAQALDPSELPMVSGVELPSLCTHVDDARLDALYTFLSTRTPNRAPRYEAVELEVLGAVEAPPRSIARGETIELAPGESLALRGVAREGDAERYRLIDADCALPEFEERLAFSWFTQAGEVSRNVTTEEEPELEWRPPDGAELPLRARVWSVLRDGRGGSDHLWFDVLVRP